MSSLVSFCRPVLLWMVAAETLILNIGSFVWHGTKFRIENTYQEVQTKVSNAYEVICRRTSDVQQGWKLKAVNLQGSLQGRVAVAYRGLLDRTASLFLQVQNRLLLVSLQFQLKISLAVHRLQFRAGLLAGKVLRRWHHLRTRTKIGVTRWKKKFAESAKVNLEILSLRAREYEDILEERLRILSKPVPRRAIRKDSEDIAKTSPSSCNSLGISTNEEERVAKEVDQTNELGSRSSAANSTSNPPLTSVQDAHIQDLRSPTAHDEKPSRPPSLPPSAPDEAQPRPPERPPKKPTLRSLFRGSSHDSQNSPSTPSQDKSGPELKGLDEAVAEVKSMTPKRSLYYKKPPAPDPPKSPTATPGTSPNTSSPASPKSPASPLPGRASQPNLSPVSHIIPSAISAATPQAHSKVAVSSMRTPHLHATSPVVPTSVHNMSPSINSRSRSSTPDLPPPPPVAEGEVVENDEPLPPPPSEVGHDGGGLSEGPPSQLPPPPPSSSPPPSVDSSREGQKLSPPQNSTLTYHKDSYMAHRKDWKTGFEGRYRKTASPSPPLSRNTSYSSTDTSGTKKIGKFNHGLGSSLGINPHNGSNRLAGNATTANNRNNNNSSSSTAGLSRLASSSSWASPASVSISSPATVPITWNALRSAGSVSNMLHNENRNASLDNGNHANNNEWAGHVRQTSTTVNFTSEELRAFKARRAAHESSSGIIQDPDRPLPSSHSSPALRSEGSSTSLGSASGGSSSGVSGLSGSPGTPPKLSPSQSWRTSLDSLHQASPISSVSGHVSPERTITRALSLGDPLHQVDYIAENQDSSHLPRTTSINDSLCCVHSRSDPVSSLVGIKDSCSTSGNLPDAGSVSATASLPGAISLPASEPEDFPQISSPATTASTSNQASSPKTPFHDGPVIAHPATVTEEPHSPLSSTVPSPPHSSKDFPSTISPKSASNHKKTVLSSVQKTPSVCRQPGSSNSEAGASSATSLCTYTSPSSTSVSLATPRFSTSTQVLTSSIVTVSTTSSRDFLSTFTTTSCTTTFPAMKVDPENIVVLRYGRKRYQEEIDCDHLSSEYVSSLDDPKMQALLAPGPEYKTTADYMTEVFQLELRRDYLSRNHPDLRMLAAKVASSSPLSSAVATTAVGSGSIPNGHNCDFDAVDDDRKRNAMGDKVPLPADSAYFTTSEGKARLLSKIKGSPSNYEQIGIDSKQLIKKKETLIKSMGRKLEILKAEQEAIQDEMKVNTELEANVTTRVVAKANPAEQEKYRRHVEGIGMITNLLLRLSGRLARAENAMTVLSPEANLEEKQNLEKKRDKLKEQLEEAKRLKKDIDRKAAQVSTFLGKYLTEEEYSDYDHFIKMKAKLIMDSWEINDKIKLGEEQLNALVSAN